MRQRRNTTDLVDRLRHWRTGEPEGLSLLAGGLGEHAVEGSEGTKIALSTIAAFGTRATPYADEVAERLDAAPEDPEVADAAVWALSTMGDDRCLASIRDRLGTTEFCYRLTTVYFPETFDGFDPPTLSEVVTPCVSRAADLFSSMSCLLTDDRTPARLKEQLLAVAEAWGPIAVPLATEVASLLGSAPATDLAAIRALAAVGAAAPESVADALDRRLSKDGLHAVEVAYAVWRTTGNARPALDAIREALESGRGYYVRYLSSMGSLAAPLLQAAQDLLEQRMTTRTEAAYAVWRLSGDGSAVGPLLADAVSPLADGYWRPYMLPALRYLAEIGPAAVNAERFLVPALASPQRFRGLRGGWRTIADDLTTCQLARTALVAIGGGRR